MPSPNRVVINTSPLLALMAGSIGVMLRARKEGKILSVRTALERMRTHGIWLSESVVAFALRESGE